MRKYEGTVLIKPTLEPAQAQEVSNKLVKLIEDNGGKLLAERTLEKTDRIQFEVKGHTAAYWQVLNFEANPEFVAEFERVCKIDDNIIRYIVLRLEEKTKKENKKQDTEKKEEK